MNKYPISDEFKAYSKFKPPIHKALLPILNRFMQVPRFLWKDPELTVEKREIESYDGACIDLYLLTPKSLQTPAPCLLNIHGGGFVMEAADYHYKLAMRYAKEAGCKVVFVQYRLAPKHPHPVFFEDCYAALCWTYDHAEELGIDRSRIGIGGDSAGATLSVGVCMMARERKHPVKFRFQMLPYPYLDARGESESNLKYTDTPMWNSILSKRIAPMTRPDRNKPDYVYYSPVEADSFEGLPPAYIETAEFDCLHDDGILYARQLKRAGIPVELNETKGTIHGYDIVLDAPTSQQSTRKRIAFMRKWFYQP